MIDDDLASVLSNITADARPATRNKIANSAETRAFLEIGLLLLRDDRLDHRGPDLLAENDAGTRLFAGLSQAQLIERSEQQDRRKRSRGCSPWGGVLAHAVGVGLRGRRAPRRRDDAARLHLARPRPPAEHGGRRGSGPGGGARLGGRVSSGDNVLVGAIYAMLPSLLVAAEPEPPTA